MEKIGSKCFNKLSLSNSGWAGKDEGYGLSLIGNACSVTLYSSCNGTNGLILSDYSAFESLLKRVYLFILVFGYINCRDTRPYLDNCCNILIRKCDLLTRRLDLTKS